MGLRTALVALTSSLSLLSCKHGGSAQPGQARAPEPKGIAAFTRHSRFVDAKISPKGTYLAAITAEGGKRSLAIVDLKTRKLAPVLRPAPQSVGDFYWANDSRVVVQLWDEDGTLAAPVNRGEIYAVDATGGRGDMIFGYRARKNSELAGGAVIGRLLHDERRILIQTIEFREVGDRISTVYKLDVYSGLKTRVTQSPIPGVTFLTDENGEPRIAVGSSADVRPRYFFRDPDEGWSELMKLKGITSLSRPVGYVSGSRTINVVEPLANGFGLYAVDIDSGERRLLSKSEWVPPREFVLDSKTGQILAVEYEPDVPSYDFLVPEHPVSRVLKGLLDAYPDENVRILSATDDEKQAIAFVYSDRDPGRFLLVDIDRGSAEELVATRPWIAPKETSAMTAFHIRAGDGMWIHGYVTSPNGSASGRPPPMVVVPHGGPHFVRDTWRFNSEVQLLASEGFAVLQVNYRGSGGYGLAYQEAGYAHWGDRIVQDIVDATRYALTSGYGDPKRVCIYGGSFGGYAAMQSAIAAPDLYRCAVGYAGVYDLTLMGRSGDIADTGLGRAYVRTVVGDDAAALKRGSPVHNADKLRARVLLIHGMKDERVPIEHAERLKQALEERGRAPEWLEEPKEGHGFYDEAARERMYSRLVRFLRENTAKPN